MNTHPGLLVDLVNASRRDHEKAAQRRRQVDLIPRTRRTLGIQARGTMDFQRHLGHLSSVIAVRRPRLIAEAASMSGKAPWTRELPLVWAALLSR
jgi:hypothetical protein